MTDPRGSVDIAEEQRALNAHIWHAGYITGVNDAHDAALGFPTRHTNPYERTTR